MYNKHQQLLYKPQKSIEIPDSIHGLLIKENLFREAFSSDFDVQLSFEIYRCMNRKELYHLIDGQKINANYLNQDRFGFSFSASKYFADLMYNTRKNWSFERQYNHHEYDYMVSFNTQIMFDNFNMVKINYNIDWFIEHPEIAWNTIGYNKFELSNFKGFCHEILENWQSNIDWKEKTELECYIEILKNINNSYFNKYKKDPVYQDIVSFDVLLGYKDQHEVLLFENEYSFVSGMITNVQSFRKQLLNELYNFLTGINKNQNGKVI